MTEKTVYKLSDVITNKRGARAVRLALIHFTELTDEEQQSELEAIQSLPSVNGDNQRKILTFLEEVIALDPEDRRELATQLRGDYRDDLLSGLL